MHLHLNILKMYAKTLKASNLANHQFNRNLFCSPLNIVWPSCTNSIFIYEKYGMHFTIFQQQIINSSQRRNRLGVAVAVALAHNRMDWQRIHGGCVELGEFERVWTCMYVCVGGCSKSVCTYNIYQRSGDFMHVEIE